MYVVARHRHSCERRTDGQRTVYRLLQAGSLLRRGKRAGRLAQRLETQRVEKLQVHGQMGLSGLTDFGFDETRERPIGRSRILFAAKMDAWIDGYASFIFVRIYRW